MDFFRTKDLRSLARSIALALRTVGGAGRSLAVLVLVGALLVGLVPVAMAIAMANLIGAAPDVAETGLASVAGDRLVAATAAYVALLTLQGFVHSGVSTAGHWLRRELDGRLRERVMRALMRPVGLRHFEDTEMRSVLEAARSAAPTSGMSPGAIAAVLPAVLGYRVGLAARLVGLTYLAWPLGLAYLLTTLKSQDEMQSAIWRVAGAGGAIPPPPVAYQLELATTAGPGKEARVFGLGSWIADRYRAGMLGHISGVWAVRRDFTPSLVVTLTASGLLHVVALVVFGRAAMRGDLGVGELAFAVSSIMALTPAFNQDDMPLAFATKTIETIEEAERVTADSGVTVAGARPAAGLPAQSIRLEGVTFRYPSASDDVLRSVDLELRAGERTALVGLNGAGKTTLVKLLAGMYEPTEGSIVVDGRIPLTELDVGSWRRQLAVLFQDFTRYELSAKDNIRYGAVHFGGDGVNAAVAGAAAAAGIGSIIERLPAGYDSPLAAGQERGGDLSGGQWQRVALARALFAIHAGAQVLILDEPTANLDVRAEAELFASLLALTSPAARRDTSQPLTTLMISHRFSTVRQADRIVVLDGGKIVEDGSHEELLARDATYAHLFRTQAEQYAEAAK